MDLIALSRLGGRHLVTLHLLLDSQSVTRTAERLCTTPSTVSKTLNQLRDLLGDQLLYRQGNQLLLTPFAERLGPTLHRLLSELNNLTSQGGFDPETWQGQLRFALRESSMVWPMGPILGQLMQEVPGLVPNVWNKDEQGLTALAAGKLDFVILPHDQSQPLPRQPGLVWETLREDRLVCLLRADHPALDKPWDLDAYLSWRHIAIRDQELANPFFEQSLAQLQVRRQIGATLPDFGSASALLRQSDLILTAIEGWALQSAALGLAIRPVPFDYGAVTHSLVWYGPAGEEPALRWFRQRILTLARELG
ncbi:LysR family transcriptional regulator [Aeromonas salmonicida]|uniref:LysR family transcriptional regulator n=4 Tax=Gammaproteobacteria TaxID=1236 RepID=A0A3L0VT48_ECOLX|nr:LysR family transcriptional regulator [Aeromonas salmonicida]ARW83759.1 LysR-family transcriptional regulator [Aeromonas salmonicida]ATP08049.1 LysR family transcription regulator [Aeromonas salmonicida subsp. pectinolytica 34mel]ATU96522.1 LysR family transcriptional regulator [Aeromonas salmonicida]EQC05221.1 LysR family transcriptional regulator [Aeromonas salmonicida subsp. pectinolytica 34mel]MDM5127024.1 LysR family transcriptional regulator [Aeromonas salmonicida]